MTAPYKKRAKSGYNTDKTISNRSERTYEIKEIQEQTEEFSKSGSAVKKKKSSVEKTLSSHITNLKFALKLSQGRGLKYLTETQGNDWFSRNYNSLYQKATQAIPFLKQKMNDPEVSNKIKKQIQELLNEVPE